MENEQFYGIYFDGPVSEHRSRPVPAPVAPCTVAEKRDAFWTKRFGIQWSGLSGMSAQYPNLLFRRDISGEVTYEPFDEQRHNELIDTLEQRGFSKRSADSWRKDMLNRLAEVDDEIRQAAASTH
jgi:hypothetical protein